MQRYIHYIYIYIYTRIHTYIYIYICKQTDRQTDKDVANLGEGSCVYLYLSLINVTESYLKWTSKKQRLVIKSAMFVYLSRGISGNNVII